jgi:hypothetical protein
VLYKTTTTDYATAWKTLTAADVGALPLTGGNLTGATTITGAGFGVTNASGSPAIAVNATGDAFTRFQLSGGAVMQFGNGSSVLDTTLQRSAAGVLSINGSNIATAVDVTNLQNQITSLTNQFTAHIHRAGDWDYLAGQEVAGP